MVKWWVALIIGVVTLYFGFIAGQQASLTALKRAEKLLDEVGKELDELKELYAKCLTMGQGR